MRISTLVFALSCAVGPSLTNAAIAGGPSSEERVLSRLHAANQAEIEAASLALQRADGKATLDFATMLKKDHTDADVKVRDVAQKDALRLLPVTVLGDDGVTMQQDHAALMAKLKPLHSTDFERVYLDAMVTDHAKVAAALTHDLDGLGVSDTQELATELLPVIKAHGEKAAEIRATLGN